MVLFMSFAARARLLCIAAESAFCVSIWICVRPKLVFVSTHRVMAISVVIFVAFMGILYDIIASTDMNYYDLCVYCY